jgi:hypothetical protein
LAPRGLAPPLHSLPPILDNAPQTPTSSCSKGSRGLSVQPRVLGIFTETTVSPDPSLRQRPSRYAIRAGRNFAFPLRFRRRRLSLHLDADSRVSLTCRTAEFRSDSFPRRTRQSEPDLRAFGVRHRPSAGRRAQSARSHAAFPTATGNARSAGSRARGGPRGDASPT